MCETVCLDGDAIRCRVVFPGEKDRISILFTNMGKKEGGIYQGEWRLGEWHSVDVVNDGPVTRYMAHFSVGDLKGDVSARFEAPAPRTRLFDLLFASGAVDVLCAFLQAAQENPLFRMHVQTTDRIPRFTGKYTPQSIVMIMSDTPGTKRKPGHAFGKESPEQALLRQESDALRL